MATASGVSEEGRKAVFTDPRCRTVRDGCKPLHARSSCDGTTALGQRREYPPALSRTLGPAGEPHLLFLRTCAPLRLCDRTGEYWYKLGWQVFAPL